MTANEASTNSRVLAGRYRVGPRRGTGVDIAIFEAVDTVLDRTVAVKLVHPDLCAAPGFAERFQAIMHTVGSIDHPNIARVHDWGSADWSGRSVLFVIAENLTGGSLRDLLDRGRQLSPSQVLMVGLDVCRGLDAAHRAGLVHGDIRPANLVFGDDGRLRIADLGMASLVAEPMWADRSSVPLGRAWYAAPEHALGQPAEPKSDVYSLCLTLVEAVTGQVPFTGDSTVATLANRVDRLMPVSADLGPLAAVLERAGRPDAADRYSAAEFGRAMVQVAEKLPRPASIPLLTSGLFSGAVAPPAAASTPAMAVAAEPDAVPSEPTAPTIDLGRPALPLPTVALPLTAPATVVPGAVPITTSPTPSGGIPLPPPVITGQAPITVAAAPPPPDAPATEALPVTTGALPMIDVPPPPRPAVAPSLLREKRSRRKILAFVAAFLLFAGLGGALAWFLARDESNAVPELVGLEEGGALNAVSEFGWDVTVEEEASDETEAGIVLRTVPTAGEKLDRGADFLVVVSSGPAPRVLPELVGSTVEQATVVLDDLDLTLDVGEQPNDELVPEGTIISWSVPDAPTLVAGDTVLPDTTVVVAVSAGPAPRVVPELTGLSLADATTRLQTLNLTLVALPEEFSDTVPVGAVTRQDPPAGATVERDTDVGVALSKGQDLVALPPLADLTVREVTDALKAAGLVLGEVSGDRAGVAVLAEVDGTALGANVQLPRGTAVDVTFEVPPPPSTEPPPTTSIVA